MAYRPSVFKIIGSVIKGLLYALVAFMVAFLIWRIWFSTKVPEKIERLVITDSLKEAYSQSGDELYAFNQQQYSLTRGDDNYGYFSVEEVVIIPDAKQVQIIFRYNNSTIDALVEDYALSETPDRTEELYQVTLLKTTDLTPDNPDDNDNALNRSETRYYPSAVIAEQTKMYNFRRIVFENVTIEEDDIGLFADIYYVEDINYEEDAYGTLCLYDNISRREQYEFSKEDLRRMKK